MILRYLTAASLLLPSLACSRPDLTTDEGVLRALNAERASDSQIDADNLCVKRPEKLPGFILVGYFAHDRGCMPGEVFIDGKMYAFEKASRPALQKLGWQKADAKGRVDLAVRWTEFGLMSFEGTVLHKEPEEFGRPGFAPISGGPPGKDTRVSLWMQNPTGMQCGTGYSHLQFTFASDGSLATQTKLGGFFNPCK